MKMHKNQWLLDSFPHLIFLGEPGYLRKAGQFGVDRVL